MGYPSGSPVLITAVNAYGQPKALNRGTRPWHDNFIDLPGQLQDKGVFITMFSRFKTRSPVSMSYYLELAGHCSVLKTIWYSSRFRGIVVVGRGSKIRVHRSARVVLEPRSILAIGIAHDSLVGAVLRLRPRSNLHVTGKVQITRASCITIENDATLTVGNGTFFNDGSSVMCCSEITIGPGCAISWGVRILDTDVHQLVRDGAASPHAPVHIGKDCWIGAGALILKGTKLGDGSVVAAGAVVASEVPSKSLVAGIPARVIRENIAWML